MRVKNFASLRQIAIGIARLIHKPDNKNLANLRAILANLCETSKTFQNLPKPPKLTKQKKGGTDSTALSNKILIHILKPNLILKCRNELRTVFGNH